MYFLTKTVPFITPMITSHRAEHDCSSSELSGKLRTISKSLPVEIPRSTGSSLAENQLAKAEVLAPREVREDAQPQPIHGVVLKDMVIDRLEPAAAPELGSRACVLIALRLLRSSYKNINFFGDHDGCALVPRHDNALPERRR